MKRDWTIILLFIAMVVVGYLAGISKFKRKHIDIKKEVVIEYKEKLVPVRDTITKIEVRLKKAKEIHDTITIIKEQDTLIKFLKVEVKVQDTIIKFQDTIINNCEQEVKKEKRKKLVAIGSAILLGIGLIIK